jgi:hypothetical protein
MKAGNGFISKVSLADGKLIELEWAKGLDAPKGLALGGDKLYTADIDNLAEIDTKSGKVLARYVAPGAAFLNDVTVDGQGNVYILERGGNALRVVNARGEIRTVAGNGQKGLSGDDGDARQATLNGPKHLCIDGDNNVLIADTELIVAERNPACLAAPAGVNDLLAIRKQRGERGAGVGRAIGQEFRSEDERACDSDRDQVDHSMVCCAGTGL